MQKQIWEKMKETVDSNHDLLVVLGALDIFRYGSARKPIIDTDGLHLFHGSEDTGHIDWQYMEVNILINRISNEIRKAKRKILILI